jgi:hypothetical protein
MVFVRHPEWDAVPLLHMLAIGNGAAEDYPARALLR